MRSYDGLPFSLRDGMRLYIEGHVETGGFLHAVLCNDLRKACERADAENQRRLFSIVCWVYNEAPSTCWGSPEKVAAWVAQRDG
jgi:hypothetical protein